MTTQAVEKDYLRNPGQRNGFPGSSDGTRNGGRSTSPNTPSCFASHQHKSSSPPSQSSPPSPTLAPSLACCSPSLSYRQHLYGSDVPMRATGISSSPGQAKNSTVAYSDDTNTEKSLVPTANGLSRLTVPVLSDVNDLSGDSSVRKRKRHRQQQLQHKEATAIQYLRTLYCDNTSYNSDDTFQTNLDSPVDENNKNNKSRGGLLFLLAMAALFGIGGGNE
ncbi:hypothetical protein EGW08_009309, partial [Elysia chlorotica]